MIVGITGKKYHGKDTVANYLKEKYNFECYAFAEPIKEICKSVFGFTDEQLYGSQKETIDEYWGKSPRYFFQTIGTDLFRNHIDSEIWIKSLQKKIENKSENVVVSDVRFKNEADCILKKKGKIVKVIRNTDHIQDNHTSETELDEIKPDYILLNLGSLHDLYKQIDQMILFFLDSNTHTQHESQN